MRGTTTETGGAPKIARPELPHQFRHPTPDRDLQRCLQLIALQGDDPSPPELEHLGVLGHGLPLQCMDRLGFLTVPTLPGRSLHQVLGLFQDPVQESLVRQTVIVLDVRETGSLDRLTDPRREGQSPEESCEMSRDTRMRWSISVHTRCPSTPTAGGRVQERTASTAAPAPAAATAAVPQPLVVLLCGVLDGSSGSSSSRFRCDLLPTKGPCETLRTRRHPSAVLHSQGQIQSRTPAGLHRLQFEILVIQDTALIPVRPSSSAMQTLTRPGSREGGSSSSSSSTSPGQG